MFYPRCAAGLKTLLSCLRCVQVTEVVHTPARGQLRCHYVIHTVGPVWSVNSDKARCTILLQKTVENVLDYAHRILHATCIALPAISTG